MAGEEAHVQVCCFLSSECQPKGKTKLEMAPEFKGARRSVDRKGKDEVKLHGKMNGCRWRCRDGVYGFRVFVGSVGMYGRQCQPLVWCRVEDGRDKTCEDGQLV